MTTAPPPAQGAMDSHTAIASGLGQYVAEEIRRRLPNYAERMREGLASGNTAGFAVYVNLGWESHGHCMVAHVNIVGDPDDLRLPIRLDANGDLQLIPQEEAMAIAAADHAGQPFPGQQPQPQPQAAPQAYAQPQMAPVQVQPQPQYAPVPVQGTAGAPVGMPRFAPPTATASMFADMQQQFAAPQGITPPPPPQQYAAVAPTAVPEPPPHVLPGQSKAPGALVQMSNGGTQRNPGQLRRRQLAGD